MSTAACPRCGRAIPAVAAFCPKCGASVTGGLVFDYAKRPPRRGWAAIVFTGLVILVVLLAMLFFVGTARVSQSPTIVAPLSSGR